MRNESDTFVTQYIIRRVLVAIPILIGVSMVVFFLIRLTPGDPISALANPEEDARKTFAEVQEGLEALGLNKPIPVQYGIWVKEALTGNLGYSYRFHRPVVTMILERLPATLSLMIGAVGLALVVGVVAGVFSAVRQYSRLDYGLTIGAFFMVSIPEFFFALMGMFIFAVVLAWLPVFGMWTPGTEPGLSWDLIHHMVLPVFALSLRDIAGFMRYTRASVLDALSSEYVTTARSKGLPESLVLWKHVFRNALLPLVTIVGLNLPSLLGGAVVIETIFSWPGVGLLGYEALQGRDYTLQMGVLLMAAIAVMAANLVTDVAYAFVDPRIRHT
ncbi:MAG: ABC transporter permease [Actinobacteria bacterium]|nr:ABC transporter permease [Actinomycetota bacterium]